MKSCLKAVLLISLLICSANQTLADTVVLKKGQTITGSIILEKDKVLILDVGFTILSIPTDQILQYEYTSDFDLPQTEPNLPALTDPNQTDKLYKTADIPKTTIEKCVEQVSESVVKISTPSGMGSGFFINQNGYLITNYHVIEKETKIDVTVFHKGDKGFQKKKFKHVKIEAINPFVDLALLKVLDLDDAKITAVNLGNIDKVEVGEKVFAIGNPLGLERTVTDGVISTKNRAFEGIVYIQTNADINPGNSGGPLFNLAGQVIGVTNMGYIFFGGLGFAIPVDYVKHFLDNTQAYAYDKDNPNTGFKYLQPKQRKNHNQPNSLNQKQ